MIKNIIPSINFYILNNPIRREWEREREKRRKEKQNIHIRSKNKTPRYLELITLVRNCFVEIWKVINFYRIFYYFVLLQLILSYKSGSILKWIKYICEYQALLIKFIFFWEKFVRTLAPSELLQFFLPFEFVDCRTLNSIINLLYKYFLYFLYFTYIKFFSSFSSWYIF